MTSTGGDRRCLQGVTLIAHDVEASMEFYSTALGFSRTHDPARLTLGDQALTLHHSTGRDYPQPRASNDPWFQHIAIVVSDIATAFRQAMDHGATPISWGGPQLLPASSGSVTAWKFRDPAGHPLELLMFPADGTPHYWRSKQGLFQGIDHTAIVVADTTRSRTFYADLGFERSGGSVNQGPEQAALDGLIEPHVIVTALSLPGEAAPHLELLEYQTPIATHKMVWDETDIVASRTMLAADGALHRDPDGHFILMPHAAPQMPATSDKNR
jgi:catechol 2,3-dioxygenase-like lactoylglutathione lyase family enzyme